MINLIQGNIQIEDGKGYDTGAYRIIAGVARKVKYKVVSFGAMPNATTKSVAHTITGLDIAYSKVTLWANNATIAKEFVGTIDATNINVTTVGDESTFVAGYAEIEYIQT